MCFRCIEDKLAADTLNQILRPTGKIIANHAHVSRKRSRTLLDVSHFCVAEDDLLTLKRNFPNLRVEVGRRWRAGIY